MSSSQIEMSKTVRYKKVMKPLLERKRRARINKCLDELKDLMVKCLTQDGEHITRLEKADILELTVEHLRKTKQHQQNHDIKDFRSGYISAANEVSKTLAMTPGIDINLGKKLMTHLGLRLNEIETTILQKGNSQMPDQKQQVRNDIVYRSSPPTSPLSVVCDHHNTYSSSTILSPTSSGYGSEFDSSDEIHSTGLLKTVTTSSSSSKENVWRPW